MLQRDDYLLRMILRMTEGFATVMGLRQQKKFEQAYDALDDLLHRLSLPKLQVLKGLAAPDVIELLSQRGVVETNKLVGVARVLREEAGVSQDAGDRAASTESLRKAVRFYAEAVRICRIQRSELPEAEPLFEMLAEAEPGAFGPDDCIALANACEAYGRYAEAENRWFHAMERFEARDARFAAGFEQGVAFYERLLRLDEELLKQGALPAEEAREGLADFTRMFGPTRASE